MSSRTVPPGTVWPRSHEPGPAQFELPSIDNKISIDSPTLYIGFLDITRQSNTEIEKMNIGAIGPRKLVYRQLRKP